ncbi:hypothetical protein [uncultured Chitinophaga sp.]|uniref:hypothetical protein n=1 Tax=uncultured Chitinophaga sp. TaxID=339340 RepID=UPI0025D6D377|nr:hypothetical protein [uncultured Chitinophaga sp.]
MQEYGFSRDDVKNFVEMTVAVIDGKTQPDPQGVTQVKGVITLEACIRQEAAQTGVIGNVNLT